MIRKVSEHAFKSKHNVYYIDGVIVKKIEEAQKGIDERKLITKLDKKTGHVRYLDYDENKWLPKSY